MILPPFNFRFSVSFSHFGSLRTFASSPFFCSSFHSFVFLAVTVIFFNSLSKYIRCESSFYALKSLSFHKRCVFFICAVKAFRKMFICLLIFGAALVNRTVGWVGRMLCCAFFSSLFALFETLCVYKKMFLHLFHHLTIVPITKRQWPW